MVELKKKVTLRAKTAETPEENTQKPQVSLKKKQAESTPKPEEPSYVPNPDGEGSKGKSKWIAAAVAGLLLVGGGYYLSQQGEEETTPSTEVVDTQDSAPANGASEQQDEQNQDGSSPTDASSEAPSDNSTDGVAPASPEQNDENASTTQNSPAPASSEAAPAKEKPSTASNSVQSTGITSTPSNALGAVEEEALEVIRGKYGNGAIRKRNLGDRYAEIQSKVNEMYRNGQVN